MNVEALEALDNFAGLRNGLREVADQREEWAGIPLPLDDIPLVVEPRYPHAQALMAMGRAIRPEAPAEERASMRNSFWSSHRRVEVVIWSKPDGSIEWGVKPGAHHFDLDLQTLGASFAWGIEQEAKAIGLLGTLVRHHTFKQYMLTGMFLERSVRSGIMYVFRRLRPTVALTQDNGRVRILCALCLHPIAYYSGSWAGAMAPTDDVIAHLMLMRGDEHMFWRRANQHPAYRPEAGL